MKVFNKYSENPDRAELIYKLARNISIIAIFFILFIAVLTITNYIQINQSDPLNNPQIQNLIKKVQQNSEDNNLKESIRTYDLIVRRAYFSSLVFNKYGSYLLLAGMAMLLLSFKVMKDIKKKLPLPDKYEEEDTHDSRYLTWRILLGLGLIIVIMAIVLPFLMNGSYQEKIEEQEISENINVIEINEGSIWTSFRGRNGLGVSLVTNVPVNWNVKKGKNVLWVKNLPKPGFNSPVIWNDRLFISGGDEKGFEVYCFNTFSGELIWTKKMNQGHADEIPDVTEDTGYAAPSLTVDGTHVYSIFATGVLTCLDFKGNVKWEKDLGIPENHYGHSSSLIIHKELLYVQFEHSNDTKVFAFNTLSGDKEWEYTREVDTSWSSPVLVESKNKVILMIVSNPLVTALDAIKGKKLWDKECMDGEVGPSVGYEDGIVFAGNEYAILAAMDISTGDILWETDEELPEVSSPLAINGLLFVATSGGTITCYEQKKGEIYWTQEYDDGFYSSPVFANGNVYIMDVKGEMFVISADKEYKLISQNELGEESTSTPAIINGHIYIRSLNKLYCIKED